MNESLLDLPKEIAWKIMSVSPDMMDTQFCNKLFPFAWRSSLAISAFEPTLEELPEELCDERITFLKITCNITGYQPSKEETDEGYASFPDVPIEQLDRIFEEYFACYGALLNVAVFPYPKFKIELKRVGIDFGLQKPGTTLPNPYASEGASFEAVNQPNNSIVDRYPTGGDAQGELDLFQEMSITLPPNSRVEAKVVHDSPTGVTMEAYRGNELLGSQTAGLEQGQVYTLTIEGQVIDRVVFKAPDDRASLLEFAYYIPESKAIALKDYPHIIDFEPKVRELLQAATETGEILTASKSGVKTNKGFTNTEETTNAFNLGAEFTKGPIKLTGGFTRTSKDTEQDTWSVETDASRERTEKEGSTTNISQLYNLLTGYHLGTNRGVFLMLPRPHILQPTDRRTFVQGLRIIEGVQEFFLIVSRPKDMPGLCVEAFLETGHFPEDVEIEEPPVRYDESQEDFIVTAFADDGFLGGSCANIESFSSATYTVGAGWVIDRSKGTPGHPGVSEIANDSNGQANSSLENYNYQSTSDTSVQISGRICGQSLNRDEARFNRTYRVFTRSEQPKPNTSDPVVTTPFLITSRGLCVCMKSGEKCPEVVPLLELPTRPPIGDSIAIERVVRINPALLTPDVTRETRSPAMEEALRKIRSVMTTSWRLPGRRPPGKVGFLDSDYFKDRIKKVVPKEQLERPLAQVSDLPRAAIESLGERFSVAEALDMELTSFIQKTGLSLEDALNARRRMLGLAPRLDGE
jgi:hypothetical protein